jgi:hypothetical protein
MLRSLQFTWETSRAAVQFYVEHIHRLVDIHPRRLVMIAQAIRDHPDPAKHMALLNRMLRDTDQRPKLKLPQTWVSMDSGLFLPKQPLSPKHRARHTPQHLPQEPIVPAAAHVAVPEPASSADPSSPSLPAKEAVVDAADTPLDQILVPLGEVTEVARRYDLPSLTENDQQ